jgi:hypothetical protein
VLARARRNEIEALSRTHLVGGSDFVRLPGPVYLLRGNELLREQVLDPLEIALRPLTRGLGVSEIRPRLLDLLLSRAREQILKSRFGTRGLFLGLANLLRSGAGHQIAQLGLGRRHRRFGAPHFATKLVRIETHQHPPALHGIAFAYGELGDTAHDLRADVHLDALDRPGQRKERLVDLEVANGPCGRQAERDDQRHRRAQLERARPHGRGSRMPAFFRCSRKYARATRWTSAAVTARMRCK